MVTKTLQSLRDEWEHLVGAEMAAGDAANAFPRGVGAVSSRNRRSRDRSIEQSVKRAKRINDLARKIKMAEMSVRELPKRREYLEKINETLAAGVLRGQTLTREQRTALKSMQSDTRRDIAQAERLMGVTKP